MANKHEPQPRPGRPAKVSIDRTVLRILVPQPIADELDAQAKRLQQTSALVVNRYDVARSVLTDWYNGRRSGGKGKGRRAASI